MAISPVFRPFEKLPTEIFEEIAFQVTTHSKVGPPVGLVSLLRLSRSIHALLDFKRNPDFYARLFRFKFNMSAAIRRFKYSRVETDRQRLQSSNLAMELKRRFKGMKRMRRAARAQSIVKTCSDEECRDDLWMAYLMLLESDGLNMDQLVLYGCLHHYIIIYRNEELFPAIVRPGFPLDRVERSLALWLLWFMSDAQTIMNETDTAWDASFRLLRPYAFASHKYDAFWAPWNIFRLPTESNTSPLPSPTATSALDPLANPNIIATVSLNAPLLLTTETPDKHVSVPLYNIGLGINPPLLSHAAILSFFVRLQKNPIVDPENGLMEPDPEERARGGHIKTRWGRCRDSRAFDADFMRMTTCLNPMTSLPDPNFFQPGMLSGDWEGRFAFIDFDSYREMLNGNHEAMYRGQLGQQPQVWRIEEHHYLRPYNPPHLPTSPTDTEFDDDDGPIVHGSSLKAHMPMPYHIAPVSGGINISHPGRENPAYYRTYADPPWTDAQLFGGEGNENWADPYGKVMDYDLALRGGEERVKHGGSRKLEGLRWVDSNRLPADDDDDDEENEKVVDIIITGSAIPNELQGHSAWGQFEMIGRVRDWDGMITILKTYNGPDGRGEWLYRGYILGNGNWVGRWRDTFTPDNMHGYEGVFAMTRRPH